MKQPVIGIIGGTGRMGQWLTHFFETRKHAVHVAGRKTKLTPKKVAKTSDIVIVAVPISATDKVISEIAPLVRKDALLTDITSLKVLPLRAMENAKSATLGMHPLFGPGIGSTTGQKIVFCKQKNNDYVLFLKELFEEAGIQVIEMAAEQHDYQMAYIQALTHAMNLLYAKILFEQSDALSKKLDTPIFMLQSLVMGRVLQQDLGLTADIQMYNPYFTPLLENLAGYSKKLLDILQREDKKAFVKLFESDKNLGQEFANFSVLHTDKILHLVSETHLKIPERPALKESFEKVSYLGPEGTYSHQGALRLFGKTRTQLVPEDTIYTVFNNVLEGNSDLGIVPAENSVEGSVKSTIDYLVDFALHVVGSFAHPIHHQLATREKSLKTVTKIISHPQALAQCEGWIRKHLPHAVIEPASSTTSGLKKPEKGVGYICSETAAKLYKIPVVEKNIEDNPENATRFYVIAKKPMTLGALNTNKTLLFLTIYNRVGILRDMLNVLAENGINMTKLESRPSHEKIWDYHFFVEVEISYNNPKLKKALKELEQYCPVIRILGQT